MKKKEISLIIISVIVATIFLVTSCNPTNQGSIVKKGACETANYEWFIDSESHSQSLVNNSKSKIITFTLKRTETYTDNGVITTETDTQINKLNPGEEAELLCEKYFSRKYDGRYSMKYEKIWIEYKYEIVGAVIEN